ncbi:cytochrome c oxidase assembly protein PET191, partial [Scleroderma citrinum]
SCDALLTALKTCLLESDCVQRHGRLPSECLKLHADELPEICLNLRKATFECKRNMASL